MTDVDARLDFRDLRVGQRVPVVWGSSRPVLNRVLFGLARSVCSLPYWVEIRAREGEPEANGPADLGWIAPDRLINLGQLFGDPPRGSPPTIEFALLTFLRDPTAEPIAQAMRLPPTPAGAAASRPEGPTVVAVANVERIEQLYPETPGAMRAVVRAFLKAGVTPFFSTLRPSKRRAAADFVFQVKAAELGEWKTGTLVCEKAPDDAYWKTGDAVPLPRFPVVAAALSGNPESPSP